MNTVKYHPCKGCHYWRRTGVGYVCHFMLLTGQRRGCEVGAGCIRRRPMDEELAKKENIQMFNRAFREYAEEHDNQYC